METGPRTACFLALLALLASLGACGDRVATESEATRATTGEAVTTSRTLTGGILHRPDPEGDGALWIETDGVVLDLGGVRLVGTPRAGQPDTPAPDMHAGIGIRVSGARDVVIRNGSIAGYRIAIRAEDAPGLVIEDVDASANWRKQLESTPEESHIGDWLWPHWNDDGEWERKYGGALSLNDCAGATVRRCRVHFGQNALLLTRCRGCRIHDNDFRFNSGWGIALFRTTDTDIAHNRCDYCVRGYREGVYAVGNDSAGILLFEQSARNRVVRNSATHCGNGFFLHAGLQTTGGTGKGGSNDVLVMENDFRYAVANGIEATFACRNQYIGNDCSGSEYGIWAGYSRECVFLENRAYDCKRDGIAIEHGNHNRIVRNVVRGGGTGLNLWWDPDPKLVDGVYGRFNDTSSSHNWIEGNVILGSRVAVRLAGDTDSTWVANRLGATEALFDLDADARPGPFVGNRFEGADTGAGPALLRNGTGIRIRLSPDNERTGRFLPLPGDVSFDGAPGDRPSAPPLPAPDPDDLPGMQDTRLPTAHPAGRSSIHVGPWGPQDPLDDQRGQPRLPLVLPTVLDRGTPRGRFFVSGRGRFSVRIDGDVRASVSGGQAPSAIDVEAGPALGLHAFVLTLVFADREIQATGTLMRLDWDVRFFRLRENPIYSRSAWQALLETKPSHRERRDSLEYEWYADGPEGMEVDRFGTLASARLVVPAGRYEIRTMSDDGIRVLVDGRRVLENWTQHAPTEDKVQIDLEAGEHALRVEHFDLGGWAYLSLGISRVPAGG